MPGYRVELQPSAERDLERVDPQLLTRISGRIDAQAIDPRAGGAEKLSGVELHRVRVGDHRILYRIDDAARAVFIHRIRHRREVYRKL